HVDGEDLRTLLVGQTEQRLYLIELVDIFPLVKQNLAVAVVDDGALDNGRRDYILDLLRDHHSLAEELSDGLEKIADITAHVGGSQCFPTLLDKNHLADAL